MCWTDRAGNTVCVDQTGQEICLEQAGQEICLEQAGQEICVCRTGHIPEPTYRGEEKGVISVTIFVDSTQGEDIPGNKMDSNNLATLFAPNILHSMKTAEGVTSPGSLAIWF